MKRIILLPLIISFIIISHRSSGQGKHYFENGDFEKSKVFYLQMVEQNPKHAEYRYYLGRSYLQLGDHSEAQEHLETATELDEENADYHYWLARAYLQRLQEVNMFKKMYYASKVQDHYQAAVDLDPDHLDARSGLAYYYANAPAIAGGSDSKSMEQVEYVIKKDRLKGLELKAGIHRELEEYDQAETAYKQLIPIHPNPEIPLYNLGMLYQSAKRYNEAFEHFEKAIHSNRDYTSAYYQFARTAIFSKKQINKSIEYMKSYLKVDQQPHQPDKASAHWRLGMLYELKNNSEMARSEYMKALKLDPQHEQAREALNDLD